MIYALLGALLFSFVAILTLLVTFGFPLGEYTLGGAHKVLPKHMRIATGISFIIQIFAVLIILYVGNMITLPLSYTAAKWICLFFAIYLVVNTAMNFFSNSKKEKYVMTPLSLICAICYLLTFLYH